MSDGLAPIARVFLSASVWLWSVCAFQLTLHELQWCTAGLCSRSRASVCIHDMAATIPWRHIWRCIQSTSLCREALEEAQTASTGDLQQLQAAQARSADIEHQLAEASGRSDAADQRLVEAEARSAQAEQALAALQQQVSLR